MSKANIMRKSEMEFSLTLRSVGKMRFPKSTLNFLHQTESHLMSPTFMFSGSLRVTSSLAAPFRMGALSSLYSKYPDST